MSKILNGHLAECVMNCVYVYLGFLKGSKIWLYFSKNQIKPKRFLFILNIKIISQIITLEFPAVNVFYVTKHLVKLNMNSRLCSSISTLILLRANCSVLNYIKKRRKRGLLGASNSIECQIEIVRMTNIAH